MNLSLVGTHEILRYVMFDWRWEILSVGFELIFELLIEIDNFATPKPVYNNQIGPKSQISRIPLLVANMSLYLRL